jgi:S1-C subfamily serine protease
MDSHSQIILNRAERLFSQIRIEEAVGKVRAIIGPANFPAGEEEAQAALTALRQGLVPTPKQLAALELVIKLMRAVLLSKEGQLEDLPEYNKYDAKLIDRWKQFQMAVRPILYSIGRIDRIGSDARGIGIGTGFLVDNNLLVTNRHVLSELSFGANVLEKGQGVVRFEQEYGSIDKELPVPILSVVAFHPTLDIALLRLDSSASRPPLTITTDKLLNGDPVVVIGYPYDDPQRNPLFIQAIYGGRFGVKRAAPGEIIEQWNNTLFHDCSTLGGNSGSPVISMQSCKVVGIHYSGFFMYRNEAVDGPSLKQFVETTH